jgi:hypothetical protein
MAGVGAIKSDRDTSALLRRITLKQSIKIMESEPIDPEEKKFKQALHLKLAGNVLPRINEHMGEGGEPMSFTIKIESGSYQEKVLKEKGII